jgi:predicted ABC-type ATPase
VVIIAGPNGAGKTTFASEYRPAPNKSFAFVNADEIARELTGFRPPSRQTDIRSARMMIDRIDRLAAAGADFMFETTLATLTYAQKIPTWRRSGYLVTLIYLRLPSVEASLDRVRRRVEIGGHAIPPENIRRRFGRSAAYLENIYKPIIDKWYICDSLEGRFTLAQSWDDA